MIPNEDPQVAKAVQTFVDNLRRRIDDVKEKDDKIEEYKQESKKLGNKRTVRSADSDLSGFPRRSNTLKIAILNDTHCGIRNSSDIFIDYQERFYNEVFFPYLNEHGIKNIVHLGDYYEHRRYINFKALNSNRKVFLERLRSDGITMDIIPGNHDTYFKNTNELNSLKELLGHYMNEVNIVMEPSILDYDGLKLGLVPWICARQRARGQ